MSWQEITVAVRKRGAIGVFWPMTEVLEASTPQAAAAIFREKHQGEFEVHHVVRCVSCPEPRR